jgi:hypothetical protein
MALFRNGGIPLGVVSAVIARGEDAHGRPWEQRLTPATAERWAFAVDYAVRTFHRRIRIRSGANGYRDLAWQEIARRDACAAGNCNGAAAPGTSSHGGNWRGRDCLAIDVDPNGLSWAQVWEACTAAGFSCGLITEEISGIPGGEPWHVIDFAAFGPVPAFAGFSAFLIPEQPKEDHMLTITVALPNGSMHTCALGVGVFSHMMTADRADIIADINAQRARDPGPYPQFDLLYLARLLRIYGCERDIWDVRDGRFVVLDPLTGSVAQGNTWSAERALLAAVRGIPSQVLGAEEVLAVIEQALALGAEYNSEVVAQAVETDSRRRARVRGGLPG